MNPLQYFFPVRSPVTSRVFMHMRGLYIKMSVKHGKVSGWEVYVKQPSPEYWKSYSDGLEPVMVDLDFTGEVPGQTWGGWVPLQSGRYLAFWVNDDYIAAVEEVGEIPRTPQLTVMSEGKRIL